MAHIHPSIHTFTAHITHMSWQPDMLIFCVPLNTNDSWHLLSVYCETGTAPNTSYILTQNEEVKTYLRNIRWLPKANILIDSFILSYRVSIHKLWREKLQKTEDHVELMAHPANQTWVVSRLFLNLGAEQIVVTCYIHRQHGIVEDATQILLDWVLCIHWSIPATSQLFVVPGRVFCSPSSSLQVIMCHP